MGAIAANRNPLASAAHARRLPDDQIKRRYPIYGKPVEYDKIRYDWALEHYLPGSKGGKESVYLILWPGRVQFDKARTPGNVEAKKCAGPTKL